MHPYHEGAQETLLRPKVVERQTICNSVVLKMQTYTVANVILEMALLDVKHLVECTGDMESRAGAVTHILT